MDQGVPPGGEPTCFLDTRQAAALLGLSSRTLEGYRVTGGGPPFLTYCNRIHYLRVDLDAWAVRSRRRSTSDDGGDEDGRREVGGGGGRAMPAKKAARAAGKAGSGAVRLSVNELAALLNVSRRTLDRYRAKGLGPAFEKVDGRIFYDRADVDAWLASGWRTSMADAGEDTPRPAGKTLKTDKTGPAGGGDSGVGA